MPDLHLSREALTAWRDERAGDREGIVVHLAACGSCRKVAANVERDRPGGSRPRSFDAGDFVPRGYRIGPAGLGTRFAGRWVWLVASAAMLVLAMTPLWLARMGHSAGATR